MCEHLFGKKGEPTPCLTCVPPLLPENRDAVRVFLLVQDQVMVAPSGDVLGLDQNAIHQCMRLYGCATPEVFESVVALGRRFIRKGGEAEENSHELL